MNIASILAANKAQDNTSPRVQFNPFNDGELECDEDSDGNLCADLFDQQMDEYKGELTIQDVGTTDIYEGEEEEYDDQDMSAGISSNDNNDAEMECDSNNNNGHISFQSIKDKESMEGGTSDNVWNCIQFDKLIDEKESQPNHEIIHGLKQKYHQRSILTYLARKKQENNQSVIYKSWRDNPSIYSMGAISNHVNKWGIMIEGKDGKQYKMIKEVKIDKGDKKGLEKLMREFYIFNNVKHDGILGMERIYYYYHGNEGIIAYQMKMPDLALSSLNPICNIMCNAKNKHSNFSILFQNSQQQMMDAIKHCHHSMGLALRNISPENTFYSDGKLLICDFSWNTNKEMASTIVKSESNLGDPVKDGEAINSFKNDIKMYGFSWIEVLGYTTIKDRDNYNDYDFWDQLRNKGIPHLLSELYNQLPPSQSLMIGFLMSLTDPDPDNRPSAGQASSYLKTEKEKIINCIQIDDNGNNDQNLSDALMKQRVYDERIEMMLTNIVEEASSHSVGIKGTISRFEESVQAAIRKLEQILNDVDNHNNIDQQIINRLSQDREMLATMDLIINSSSFNKTGIKVSDKLKNLCGKLFNKMVSHN